MLLTDLCSEVQPNPIQSNPVHFIGLVQNQCVKNVSKLSQKRSTNYKTLFSWVLKFKLEKYIFLFCVTFTKFLLPRQCPKFGISKQYLTVSWNFSTFSHLSKTRKPKWLLLSYCRQLWWTLSRICGWYENASHSIKSFQLSSKSWQSSFTRPVFVISKLNWS